MRRSMLLPTLAFALAACRTQPVEPPAPPPLTVPQPPSAPVEPAPETLAPPKPPAPKPPPSRPQRQIANPEELIGLDPDAVSRLLGEPSERSSQAGARLMTYRKRDCQLDIILYRDIKSGVDRVLSYEMSPAGRNCYDELMRGTR